MIAHGRRIGVAPPGTVLFLIGVRFNRPWKVQKWLPVFRAMPRMLAELRQQPDLGMLGCQTYLAPDLTVLITQYWASFDCLEEYARAEERSHLPAWRNFNKRVRASGDVGIFHETYVVGEHETMYVNMPEDFGLGGVAGFESPTKRGHSARHRMDSEARDTPAVEPY